MNSENPYHLNIEIDKLTNSILNTLTNESIQTDVQLLSKDDLKTITKKNGWLFSWKSEAKLEDRILLKLVTLNDPKTIHGLASISDYGDHYYLHLVESAPFNLGKNKLYQGVPGNLFAYTCRVSWNKGYEGFVSFTSKTLLIKHYEESLGATHVGGHKMVIFPHEALKLIRQYYPTNNQ